MMHASQACSAWWKGPRRTLIASESSSCRSTWPRRFASGRARRIVCSLNPSTCPQLALAADIAVRVVSNFTVPSLLEQPQGPALSAAVARLTALMAPHGIIGACADLRAGAGEAQPRARAGTHSLHTAAAEAYDDLLSFWVNAVA
jgi:hypothetical protein